MLGTFVNHVSDKSGLFRDITEMIEHAWKISDMYQHARNNQDILERQNKSEACPDKLWKYLDKSQHLWNKS